MVLSPSSNFITCTFDIKETNISFSISLTDFKILGQNAQEW